MKALFLKARFGLIKLLAGDIPVVCNARIKGGLALPAGNGLVHNCMFGPATPQTAALTIRADTTLTADRIKPWAKP